MSIRLPLNAAAGAAAGNYAVVADYDPADPALQSTTIEVESGGDPERTKIIAAFDGELWFRREAGPDETPSGEYLLSMNLELVRTLGKHAAVMQDEIASCLCYENIVVDRNVLLAHFAASINQAKGRRHRPKDRPTIKLSDLPALEILELFLHGLISLPVSGGTVLPIILPGGTEVPFTFSMVAISWPDVATPRSNKTQEDLASRSAGSLIVWGMDPANSTLRLHQYPVAAAIPLGYFYGSIPKTLLADASHAEHPALATLVGNPTNFFGSAAELLRTFVGAMPRWRAFQLVAHHAPRYRESLWPGWVRYVLEVDGSGRPISLTGRSYAKLANTDVTCRVLREGSPVLFWQPLSGSKQSSLDVELGDDDFAVPLVVELPDATFLVRRMQTLTRDADGKAQFGKLPDADRLERADQHSGASLGPADQGFNHAVYSVCDGSVVFELCTGRYAHGVFYARDDAWRFGIVDRGGVSPGQILRDHAAYFTGLPGDRAWTTNQLAVLGAVIDAIAENEGKLDAVNTTDRAFLSAGFLQWTTYTEVDHAGELAALLRFVDQFHPAIMNEYFRQFGLDHSRVSASVGDNIPRGHLKLNGAELSSFTERNQMRDYRWALLFKVAATDLAYQKLMIEYARERLKILRDYTIGLSDGTTRTVAELFTSQLAVALILDQHTNFPAKVVPNLVTVIGARVPEGGADGFSQAQLAVLLPAYEAVREMNHAPERAKSIKKAGLNAAPGTFDWPVGDRNDWLS